MDSNDRRQEIAIKMNEPKIPVKIWVMLGLVILFALLLSYFLVIGISRRRCNRVLTTPDPFWTAKSTQSAHRLRADSVIE